MCNVFCIVCTEDVFFFSANDKLTQFQVDNMCKVVFVLCFRCQMHLKFWDVLLCTSFKWFRRFVYCIEVWFKQPWLRGSCGGFFRNFQLNMVPWILLFLTRKIQTKIDRLTNDGSPCRSGDNHDLQKLLQLVSCRNAPHKPLRMNANEFSARIFFWKDLCSLTMNYCAFCVIVSILRNWFQINN